MTMRALIIGGTGFIGSHTVRRFVEGGAEVAVFGPPVPGPDLLADLGEQISHLGGDVREPAQVMAAVITFKPEVIVHLAAYSDTGTGLVRSAMADPVKAVQVNVNGFLHTLEAARVCGVGRVVWTSSTALLGTVAQYGAEIVDEDAPPYPSHLYGATKVMAEHLAHQYRQAYGMEIVAMRPTIVYGPGLWYRGVAGTVAEMFLAAAQGYPYQVEDPGEAWDLLYVKDAAEALWVLATVPYAGPEVVHVNGHTDSLGDLTRAITRAAPQAKLEVVPGGRSLGIPLVATDRAALWGITPRFNRERAIQDFLAVLAGDSAMQSGGR
jgi:nucleoside-diphosphate-sugar epimerase